MLRIKGRSRRNSLYFLPLPLSYRQLLDFSSDCPDLRNKPMEQRVSVGGRLQPEPRPPALVTLCTGAPSPCPTGFTERLPGTRPAALGSGRAFGVPGPNSCFFYDLLLCLSFNSASEPGTLSQVPEVDCCSIQQALLWEINILAAREDAEGCENEQVFFCL